MLQVIYIFVCIISIIRYFNRKFDLLTIAVLSYIFYTLSCVIGETWITKAGGYYYYANIDVKTYICVFIQLIIINFFPCVIKEKKKHFTSSELIWRKKIGGKTEFEIIFVISVSVFLYNLIFVVGLDQFFSLTSKSDIMSSVSGIFSYSIWGILISFTYGILSKRRWIIFISSCMLFLMLIMGSRSYFVIAVLILLLTNAEALRKTVSENWKKIIILIILMFILLVYKEVYRYIRALDFESVISTLENYRTYLTVFTNDETRTTFSLYNYVIEKNYTLSLVDSLVRILSFIPFINNVFPTSLPIRFSSIAKNNIFGSTYGLGSSFWGESFAMGGFIFLIVVTCIWIGIIKKYNNRIAMTNKTAPFWSVFMVYFTFYIHRLDWVQMWGALKSIIVWYIIFRILKELLKRRYT